MTEESELDTPHFLTAGLAVAAVAAAAGWLVFLIGNAFSSGTIKVPTAPGAGDNVILTGDTVLRTGFIAGIVGTAVLWLLLILVPTPTKFFGWLGGLLTLAAAVLPFTFHVTTQSKIWLALINLAIGLVVVSLLVGVVPKVMRPKGLSPA
ncbi:MAG: DUF6069 family protein [Actinobacteria bacterium]|nr:DUF6069 family protein [Actinomycetota bacterium]